MSADLLIGTSSAHRSDKAWIQVYRSVEHGVTKTACDHKAVMAKFPQAIVDFALVFKDLQEKRHGADYDPNSTFDKSSILQDIDNAEDALASLRNATKKDRRAFAAWVCLYRNRKHL